MIEGYNREEEMLQAWGTACTDGCCVRTRDTDIRCSDETSVGCARPMYAVIPDRFCDDETDHGHEGCMTGSYRHCATMPNQCEHHGGFWVSPNSWEELGHAEARWFIEVFRATYADLLEPAHV